MVLIFFLFRICPWKRDSPPTRDQKAPADCNFIENWYIGKFLRCRHLMVERLKLLWSCPWFENWGKMVKWQNNLYLTSNISVSAVFLILVRHGIENQQKNNKSGGWIWLKFTKNWSKHDIFYSNNSLVCEWHL